MPVEYVKLGEAVTILKQFLEKSRFSSSKNLKFDVLEVIKTDSNDERVRWKNSFRLKKLPKDMAYLLGIDVVVYIDSYSWNDVDCGVRGIREHRDYIICSAMCCIIHSEKGFCIDYTNNKSVEILADLFPSKISETVCQVYSKIATSDFAKKYILSLLTPN